MNIGQTFLVQGPDASNFLDMGLHPTSTKALLGDPEQLDAWARADVQSAHIEYTHSVNQLVGLVKDETRPTLYDKHLAAKALANKAVEKLTKVRDYLTRTADKLTNEAVAEADEALGPKSDHAQLHSEIRSYFREVIKQPEGLSKIKAAISESDDAAAALWHSPSFLTGIPPDTHEELRYHALQARRPAIYAKFSSSLRMTETAEKFTKVIKRIPSSFYNEQILKNATATRVEV